MLFASGDYDGLAWIFVMFIAFMGIRNTCRVLKNNDTVRGAAKSGFLHLIGKIFK